MKRIAVGLGVLTLLVLAGAGRAELCENCKGRMYITSVGKCVECGGFTTSGAHKLCPKCSARLGQCEHCRAPLKAAKRQADKKHSPAKPAKIDTRKDGTYTSGKWKYQYTISAVGTRSERRFSWLTYDGNQIAGVEMWDRIKTPWGMMRYYQMSYVRGWMPELTGGTPIDPKKGRLLPSPTESAPTGLAPLELDESADGKTVSAVVGQQIIIRLKGNPTTGYQWVVGKIEGDALGHVGGVKYVSDQPPAPAPGTGGRIMMHRVGGGGKYVFTFTAKKAGKAKLTLEYKRGWEKNKPAAQTFTLTVNVKADRTAERVRELKDNIDSFKLTLRYHGPQNKLLYRSLVLSRISALVKSMPGFDHVTISKEQAEKVIEHLAQSGYLQRARPFTKGALELHKGPSYVLQIYILGQSFYEDIGWGLPTLKRLDGLRKVLDGDPAKAMDKLLERLESQRKKWEKKPA
ncbi:MAG: protease inhibitor I42 family protein [Planctomycetota bacterium]|nr:protease inhibitor I42 family protein [Planctomycetota bacterium]